VSGTVDFSGTSIGGDLSSTALSSGLFCRPWRIRLACRSTTTGPTSLSGPAGSLFCPTHITGNAPLPPPGLRHGGLSGPRIDN
jgi:hypothetical protein